MRIGDYKLTPDQARDHLCDYARQYAKTILWDDLAGNADGQPAQPVPPSRSTRSCWADVGRLAVIDARLDATDAPLLLEAAHAGGFRRRARDGSPAGLGAGQHARRGRYRAV